MTITEKLLEEEIKGEHYLEAYKNSVASEYFFMDRAFYRPVIEIFRDGWGRQVGVRTQRSLNINANNSLKRHMERVVPFVKEKLEETIQGFSEIEKEKIEKVTGEDVKVPTFDLTKLMDEPISLGTKRVTSVTFALDQWQKNMERDFRTESYRLRTQVFDPKEGKKLLSTALTNNRQQMAVLLGTIVAFMVNRIKYAYAKENDFLTGYTWISILDGRTTDYCRSRHMQTWYFKDSKKSTLRSEEYPPGHFGCRSGVSYIYRDDAEPDRPDYFEWFERQSDADKRQILGPNRYPLYASGQVSITGFYQADTGVRYTLEQIQRMLRK